MSTRIWKLILCSVCAPAQSAVDLPTAPSEELLKVYAQLRAIHGSEQWAVGENVEWQRDAATFTFGDRPMLFRRGSCRPRSSCVL